MAEMRRPEATQTGMTRPTEPDLGARVVERLLRKTPKQLAEFHALSTKVQGGKATPTELASFGRQLREVIPVGFLAERKAALSGDPALFKQGHQWITAALAKKGSGVSREFQTSTLSTGLPQSGGGATTEQVQAARDATSGTSGTSPKAPVDPQVPQDPQVPSPGPVPEYMTEPQSIVVHQATAPERRTSPLVWGFVGLALLGGGFFLYRRFRS